MQTKEILFIIAVFTACPAFAQKLPPPAQNIFKCEQNGKVVYSDAPCLGAKRVDIQPSRGLNKSSGTERIGADVRREIHNEQMADALRPIFGESADQYAKRHRRATLSAKSQTQCERLDQQIPAAEKAEAQTESGSLLQTQQHLLHLRTQYIDFKC